MAGGRWGRRRREEARAMRRRIGTGQGFEQLLWVMQGIERLCWPLEESSCRIGGSEEVSASGFVMRVEWHVDSVS